jgi:hypothetical protein
MEIVDGGLGFGLTLAAGALLLIAGKRLFWLFVGLVGFFAGLRLGAAFLPPDPEWMQWTVAALFGILGMFLALIIQKLAVVLAGFFVGGFFAADLLGVDFTPFEAGDALIFVVGGVLAALLAVVLFKAALILLSSIAGAGLIVNSFSLDADIGRLVLIALIALGIAVQAGLTGRSRSSRSGSRRE